MGDGYEVDPEAIRDIGLELVDGIEPLTSAAGEIPEADAGLMTVVIEKAVTTLLEALTGYVGNVASMADEIVGASLRYHDADLESQADLAQLLMPGSTEQEAENMTADDPSSVWGQLQEQRTRDFRDLFEGNLGGGPSSPPTADGLEGLLLGPLETDGGSRAD